MEVQNTMQDVPEAPGGVTIVPSGPAGTSHVGDVPGNGARTPDLPLYQDPETRARLAMAAESDLEAFRYAHWRGMVTFHDVAASWFHMSDPNLTEELRAEFKTLFPRLLDAFAEPRHGIITSYFCRHLRVAAALTDIGHAAEAPEGVPEASLQGPPPEGIRDLIQEQPERAKDGRARRRRRPRRPFQAPAARSSAIHIEPTFGDPEDWKAKEILFQCLHLHYKALEFLTPQPRKICMRLIFGVITALLGSLDHREASSRKGADLRELQGLEEELRQAEAYYLRASQRQAQLEYLLGMVGFLVAGGAATIGLAVWTSVLDDPLIVSMLAGAVGAVVSVMQRMTNGNLLLRPESGKQVIRALGVFRPVIGAVFGAVIFLFLDGGIIEVLSPPEEGANLAFYAGLGFLSGFSERFAQDAIASVGGARRGTPETPVADALARPGQGSVTAR